MGGDGGSCEAAASPPRIGAPVVSVRVTGRWGEGTGDSGSGGGGDDDDRGVAAGSAPPRGRMGAPEASVRVTAVPPGVV